MKITQSSLDLQSRHASASLRSSATSMRAWVGQQRPDFEGRARLRAPEAGVSLALSEAARQQLARHAVRSEATGQAAPVSAGSEADQVDPRLRVLMDMVEAITGRAVTVFDARALQAPASAPVATTAANPASAEPAATAQPAGWGLEIDTQASIAEMETTQVSAQGVVKTADGQEIHFSLQLEMSRSFVQSSSTSIRAGDALRKDPLVINFNGAGVELSDAQFAFDLNADGQTENIAFVTGGSGLLVLDKNADGRINDGSELFGSRSGDGFADLAKLDQDGNQWIDENDAVYSQLQVWQRDVNGQDHLSSLAQNGVGALYLGRVASPFSVKAADNQTLGQVRSTGVFLYESGLAGTLQQVDL